MSRLSCPADRFSSLPPPDLKSSLSVLVLSHSTRVLVPYPSTPIVDVSVSVCHLVPYPLISLGRHSGPPHSPVRTKPRNSCPPCICIIMYTSRRTLSFPPLPWLLVPQSHVMFYGLLFGCRGVLARLQFFISLLPQCTRRLRAPIF